MSRGAPVLKKRGQKSRGTSHEAGLYRSPRSCVGGNARGGMKRRGGVGRLIDWYRVVPILPCTPNRTDEAIERESRPGEEEGKRAREGREEHVSSA